MNRTDINELIHAMSPATVKNSLCPVHIDPLQDRRGVGGNGNDTGTMNYAGSSPCTLKKAVQRSVVQKITGNRLNIWGNHRRIGVIRQYEGAYLCTAMAQFL